MVDLQNKPTNFTQIYAKALAGDESVRAKVPVLEADGTVLVESLVILEYLQDRWPVADTSPEQRALARLFAERFSSSVKYVPLLRSEPGSDAEREALEGLVGGLKGLDAFLREFSVGDSPFLLDSFSLAEEACAPFAQRLCTVLPALRPEHDPRALLETHGLPRLAAWFEAVCARPSCTATLMPAEDLVASFAKMLERMKAAA